MSKKTNIIEVAFEELVRLDQLQQALHRSVARSGLKVSDTIFSLNPFVFVADVQALIVIPVLVQVSIKDSARNLGGCIVH